MQQPTQSSLASAGPELQLNALPIGQVVLPETMLLPVEAMGGAGVVVPDVVAVAVAATAGGPAQADRGQQQPQEVAVLLPPGVTAEAVGRVVLAPSGTSQVEGEASSDEEPGSAASGLVRVRQAPGQDVVRWVCWQGGGSTCVGHAIRPLLFTYLQLCTCAELFVCVCAAFGDAM